MNNLKVLITGATGSIGNEVLKQLYILQKPSNITVLVRKSKKTAKLLKPYSGINVRFGNITNYKDVEKACVNQDYVIHLAAVIPPLADENISFTQNVNFSGTKNVVRALESVAPKAFFLFSSSIAVYGDRLSNPNIRITDELIPSYKDDYYSQTKVNAEKIIRESSLSWSIFRLSAIMGIGNHKISKIMFHMPLETALEIATVEDTARAFVNSIGKKKQLENKIFNLGGGEVCRTTYSEFLSRAFKHYGMGKVDFPNHAFAKINFHCGLYMDGDALEEIVHFRKDTLDTYFIRFANSVPSLQRLLTTLVNKPVKRQLLRVSEPYKAYKTNDKEMLVRFFGNHHS